MEERDDTHVQDGGVWAGHHDGGLSSRGWPPSHLDPVKTKSKQEYTVQTTTNIIDQEPGEPQREREKSAVGKTAMTDLRQPRRGRGLSSSSVSPRMASTQHSTPRANEGMTSSSSRSGSSQNVFTITCTETHAVTEGHLSVQSCPRKSRKALSLCPKPLSSPAQSSWVDNRRD